MWRILIINYYQQLHLKYLCNLVRHWLQAHWGWHYSVETCRSVIICGIITHLLITVQIKNRTMSSVDKKPNKEFWKKILKIKTVLINVSHFTSIWKDDTNSKITKFTISRTSKNRLKNFHIQKSETLTLWRIFNPPTVYVMAGKSEQQYELKHVRDFGVQCFTAKSAVHICRSQMIEMIFRIVQN
jgi:hypothetical protein